MKFAHPELSTVVDTNIGKINTIVIENQVLFRNIVEDIQLQIDGYNGIGVVSDNDKILAFSKHVELISNFYPFEINRKNLISHASRNLEKNLLDEYYEKTMMLLGQLETVLMNATMNMAGDIQFTKLDCASIIKGIGLEFRDEYSSLLEKIIDYFELVLEYEGAKIFFVVNLRSFASDDEIKEFMSDVLMHGIPVIMIENKEYPLSEFENRLIIDIDLCEMV